MGSVKKEASVRELGHGLFVFVGLVAKLALAERAILLGDAQSLGHNLELFEFLSDVVPHDPSAGNQVEDHFAHKLDIWRFEPLATFEEKLRLGTVGRGTRMNQLDLGVENSLTKLVYEDNSGDAFGSIRDAVLSQTAPLSVRLDVEGEARSEFALGFGHLLHHLLHSVRAVAAGIREPLWTEHFGTLSSPDLSDLRSAAFLVVARGLF